MTGPDREQVARSWTELISGGITRADAHALAAPWVEEKMERVTDPMTRDALLHLHGFDLTYTGDGKVGRSVSTDWLHSEEDITTGFSRWQKATAEYDHDPVGYRARARQCALELLRKEQREF